MSRRALVLSLLAVAGMADETEINARLSWAEARLALKGGDRKAAVENFEKAIKGLPSEPMLLLEAARCAFDLGDVDRAEAWIAAVVRTSDEAFKASDNYQEAFTLAAKVRAAREAERKSAEYERESAEYRKQIDFIAEAIGRIGSPDSMGAWMSRTFVTIHMPEPERHPLKENLAVPDVFSGWCSHGGGSCSLEIDGIRSEKTATAVFHRLLGIAEERVPGWQDVLAKGKRPRRIVKCDVDSELPDDQRWHGIGRIQATGYAEETKRVEVDRSLVGSGEVKLVVTQRAVFAIAIYEVSQRGVQKIAPEHRRTTYRVVVRITPLHVNG